MLDRETRQIAETKAREFDLPPPHVLAVVDVESNGAVFATIGGKQLPMVLFEPHILYRLTKGEIRDDLVAEKLASPKWNKKLYAKTQAGRWAQLKRASEIAGPIAYEAASYGVGQVLGLHWKALGFDGIEPFLDKMFAGAGGQIDIMLRFIKVNGLDDELADGRWAAFARGYNGPAYKKNAYDTKLEAAAVRYGGDVLEPDGMLRMGAKGARVRELQTLLTRAGHQVKVDGDFGNATRDALKAFQRANGLKADGVYGPATEKALATFRQSETDKPGAQAPLEIPDVVKGVGTALGGPFAIEKAQEAIDTATGQLQQYEAISPFIGYGLTALSVLGVAVAIGGIWWAVNGYLKSKQTTEA